VKLTTGGARSRREVDPNYLALLDAGVAQSRTHVEQMSMSPTALLRRAFPSLEVDKRQLESAPFIARLRITGSMLRESLSTDIDRADQCWISDTVRGWLAMSIAADHKRSLAVVITDLLPYASDRHFAVREWAWLAARPNVCEQPQEALRILAPVIASRDPLLRRFAVELTRPRSVWGSHIREFKEAPEQAERYLSSVRCDASSYVQTAAGNWINDVARTRPDWVERITETWSRECDCRATTRIVKRGRRSLRRAA
jgi:3-methyladenine DNA glycosylase AlkC